MIRNYILQALTMMRQHKLFTGIYIGGTAISLAFAMTLFIIFNIQISPAYPEYSRDRLVVLSKVRCHSFTGAEYVSLVTEYGLPGEFVPRMRDIEGVKHLSCLQYSRADILVANDKEFERPNTVGVDDVYWEIFDFEFIHGAPFGYEELNDKKAVISESFAKRVFAHTDVVGEQMCIDSHHIFTVVGVVKDAPGCMGYTSYDIFVPLNQLAAPNYFHDFELLGNMRVLIEAEGAGDIAGIKKEANERYARFVDEVMQRNKYTEYKYTFYALSHWQEALDLAPDDTVWDAFQSFFFVIIAFLFIPALNLSGMIASRMKSRLSEIGVRKAYGATNGQILRQVLWENLLLTLAGAVVGLGLSFLITDIAIDDILAIIFGYKSECQYSVEMLFSPRIFVAAFVLCLVLNIASALLPAALTLKKNIVESLYNKR